MENNNNVDIEMKRKKKRKKIIITAIVLTVLVVVLLFSWPLLLIGGIYVWEMTFDRPAKPEITRAEFPFEIVYEYKGEEYSIKDTIVCEYDGVDFALDGGSYNVWNVDYVNNDFIRDYDYPIIEEENPDFYISYRVYGDYLMGESEKPENMYDPYILYYDMETEEVYEGTDLMEEAEIKIISWDLPEPIENSFK